MNPITSFIKRHPQVTFWGLVWSANFLGWYMAAKYPSDLWLLGISAVFLAGLFVTAVADGRDGLKTYLSRIVRWRVGLKWYAAALLLPLVLRLAAFGLNIASGAALPTNIQWPAATELIAGFLFVFFTIALFEEPGFRGFALPRFLDKYSALTAGLLLGVLHTIWHLPNFITGDDAPVVILIIISGAVLNTWLFNNTNGSVFIAMLLHASVNLWAEIFSPLFSGSDAERQTIWLAIGFVVMAILLPILTGRELGRKTEPAIPAVTTDQPLVAR